MPKCDISKFITNEVYCAKQFYTVHCQQEMLLLNGEPVLIPSRSESEAYDMLSKLVNQLGITRTPLYLQLANIVLYYCYTFCTLAAILTFSIVNTYGSGSLSSHL